MREFQGHVVTPGTVTAEAVVTHVGFDTYAAFQKALQLGDRRIKCHDPKNPELMGKTLTGRALCLPRTVGSTLGGLLLYSACKTKRQPACMLFSEKIDPLSCAGAVLAAVWIDTVNMPVIDCLGDEFLNYVKDGMSVTVEENGVVKVD